MGKLQGKETKSTHLKQLEEVFERKARRFSPFAVLGLTEEKPESVAEEDDDEQRRQETVDAREDTVGIDSNDSPGLPDPPRPGPTRPTHGWVREKRDKTEQKQAQEDQFRTSTVANRIRENEAKTNSYTNISSGLPDPPRPGPTRPTHGWDKSSPGVGFSDVVVVSDFSTTTNKKPTPPMGQLDPDLGLPDPPIEEKSVKGKVANLSLHKSLQESVNELPAPVTLQLADIVSATQLGAEIGAKARLVLDYLNNVRSMEQLAYTVPVGYRQISETVGVDSDYLRRKVLPKLAMLGVIAVARKTLQGTIYHLPHAHSYIQAVVGRSNTLTAQITVEGQGGVSQTGEQSSFPEWIDRELWGTLSLDSIERLIEKAGSETQAQEKLDIIIYNETHGSATQRVRNRKSVLAHYLSSPHAELWPNDDKFETLEMRKAKNERERARKEKALAEEAILARQEANKTQFVASLSQSQIQWLRKEAKRQVDLRSDSRFVSSKYPLYKAREEELIAEWMDRSAYEEKIPEFAVTEKEEVKTENK
jgi:hypothetical protein